MEATQLPLMEATQLPVPYDCDGPAQHSLANMPMCAPSVQTQAA